MKSSPPEKRPRFMFIHCSGTSDKGQVIKGHLCIKDTFRYTNLYMVATCTHVCSQVTAATEKDSDSNTLNNGWQPANVTFDPSQPATRRASIQMERRMSTVTFDPITSSHDNRSRSERRGSHANLDPGCHDNVTSERRMSTVTFDGVISSSHDNQQTSNHNERPLTSGSSKVSFQPAADELEGEGGDVSEGSGGGEEGGGEGEEREEEEGGEDRGVLSEQSEIV